MIFYWFLRSSILSPGAKPDFPCMLARLLTLEYRTTCLFYIAQVRLLKSEYRTTCNTYCAHSRPSPTTIGKGTLQHQYLYRLLCRHTRVIETHHSNCPPSCGADTYVSIPRSTPNTLSLELSSPYFFL